MLIKHFFFTHRMPSKHQYVYGFTKRIVHSNLLGLNIKSHITNKVCRI